MSFRCVSAFEFANRMYAYGALVDDDDHILTSHRSYFALVDGPAVVDVEAASAAPGEVRHLPAAKKVTPKRSSPHKTAPSSHPNESKG